MQDLKERVEEAIVRALELRTGRHFPYADVVPTRHHYKEQAKELIDGFDVLIEQLQEREAKLVEAIRKTLEDNGHLADGDNCTLIDLKNILKELGIDV